MTDSTTGDTARTRQLRELITDWNTRAHDLRENYEVMVWRGQAAGYSQCAKELAAVLDTEGDRPPDVFVAVEDMLAKHCRGYMGKPTTRENIAELIDRILTTDANRVQQMQSLQRQIDAVDRALGFPDGDGHGRVEMIQRLRADTEGDQPTPTTTEPLPEFTVHAAYTLGGWTRTVADRAGLMRAIQEGMALSPIAEVLVTRAGKDALSWQQQRGAAPEGDTSPARSYFPSPQMVEKKP